MQISLKVIHEAQAKTVLVSTNTLLVPHENLVIGITKRAVFFEKKL
jgi:hypothetical protein